MSDTADNWKKQMVADLNRDSVTAAIVIQIENDEPLLSASPLTAKEAVYALSMMTSWMCKQFGKGIAKSVRRTLDYIERGI